MKNLSFVLVIVSIFFALTSCQKEKVAEMSTVVETAENIQTPKTDTIINPELLVESDVFSDEEAAVAIKTMAKSRSSSTEVRIASKTAYVEKGEWYRYSIPRKNLWPNMTYVARVIPLSDGGDPDLFIVGGTPPYYTANLRNIVIENKGRGEIDKGEVVLYDMKETEDRLDFWVKGFTATRFTLEVSYYYDNNCFLSTGRGSAEICQHMSWYEPYKTISSQSRHWSSVNGSHSDALLVPALNRSSVLKIDGGRTDYMLFDLKKGYTVANADYRRPYKRISWEMYIPHNSKAQIIVETLSATFGEVIFFNGNTNTAYLTSVDGKEQSFKFETGKWLKMEFYINHSSYAHHFSATRKLVIDNTEVVNWGSYSPNRSQDTHASNTIGGLKFRGTGSHKYYLDSFCFENDMDKHPY